MTPVREYMTDSAEFNEHISAQSKLSYSIANATNGILSGLGEGQIMFFYNVKYGMSPALQGIAWLLFAIWNALNDPLFGIIEEKTKSKLGRRVPWVRYGAPLYAISFVFIWFPFAAPGDQVGLFVNFLVMLCIFDTLFSMIGLITYSLPAEMAVTSKERASIMIYSTAVGIGGQMIGIILPIAYLQGTGSSIPFWQLLMVILAVGCGVAMYGSSYYLKENKWAQREESFGFVDSLKETIKNKPFLVFETMNFAMQACQTVLFSGILYVFTFVMPLNLFPDVLYFVPIIGILVVVIYFFNKYINRIGIKHLFMYGCAAGALGFGLLPFFGRSIASQFIPLTLIMIWLASYLLSGTPLMADVIDNDELLTGKRRETTYAGVNALITKPSISIANWLFLGILGIYGFIQSEPGQPNPVQPASVGDGVVLAFSIIPVVCLVISIVAMKYYNLDGPEWAAKKRMIQETHIQKEKDFVETLQREGKI